MKHASFSVLMSLYIGEKAGYFAQCMKSIFAQTVCPAEIVIVRDGPITKELETVLEHYQKRYTGVIKTVCLEKNQGLGPALAHGIRHCTYELVARMDTDDIARKDRFEKQLAEFEKDRELDILGSYIKEFSGNVKNIAAIRRVPLDHEGIVKYQKQRSAFNHVTVMYKKSAVIRAGNYPNLPLMEDSFLWVRMIQTGAKCKNTADCFVYVRAGYEMIKRRGGRAYFQKYREGRRKILETGYIRRWDYYKTIWVQGIVAMLPEKLRMLVFLKLLRESRCSAGSIRKKHKKLRKNARECRKTQETVRKRKRMQENKICKKKTAGDITGQAFDNNNTGIQRAGLSGAVPEKPACWRNAHANGSACNR